jgi:hypothetical protein
MSMVRFMVRWGMAFSDGAHLICVTRLTTNESLKSSRR